MTEDLDGGPRRNQRRGEPSQRLGDQDHLGAAANGIDYDVRVLTEPGGVIVTGQVRSHHVVAERFQLGFHQVPVPRARPRAMDQCIGRHRLSRRYRAPQLIDNQRPPCPLRRPTVDGARSWQAGAVAAVPKLMAATA